MNLFYRMLCVSRTLDRLMIGNLRKQGLSPAQIRVLGFLGYGDETGRICTQSDIRIHCAGTRASSVTSLLQSLERQGLIARSAGEDARLKVVTLTEQGKSLAQSCRQFMDKVEKDVSGCFTDAEAEIFIDGLNRVEKKLTALFAEVR